MDLAHHDDNIIMAQDSSHNVDELRKNMQELPQKQQSTGDASVNAPQQRSPTIAESDLHPPEIAHVSQGFFPFNRLLNRAAQQCWNEISELFNELADPGINTVNGNAALSNDVSTHKRSRTLQFAQAKRAEFIKLLVLSQWSRRAADVSKLIDLQAFLRMKYQSYNDAVLLAGEMKRDLVRAQMGNPDLNETLSILSVEPATMALKTGLVPVKPLSPSKMLCVLQTINRILQKRLVIHEDVPPCFSRLRIHDGRVTFTVEDEFELDVSVASESGSQFYFVELRFLFEPSAVITADKLFQGLDDHINTALRDHGLRGCFEMIHNLVLTNKITILHQQAQQLLRSTWLGSLRVDLLHRTLVVHYWPDRSSPKSWIQISVRRGRLGISTHDSKVAKPSLALRWVREGMEAEPDMIHFNQSRLSMHAILNSTIAAHAAFILRKIYDGLCLVPPFMNGALYIGLHTSTTEPGDCFLVAQLTRKRSVRVIIDVYTGGPILQMSPPLLGPYNSGRAFEQSRGDIVNEICRLRCFCVKEELRALLRRQKWRTVSPPGFHMEDLRQMLPPATVNFDVYQHDGIQRDWAIVQASGYEGDSWWIIQFAELHVTVAHELLVAPPIHTTKCSINVLQLATDQLHEPRLGLSHSYLASLERSLVGLIVMHQNASHLDTLRVIPYTPLSSNLILGPDLQVPSMSICYRSYLLPQLLRLDFPSSRDVNPLLRETIKLSFGGINARTHRAILVARGRLVRPMANLSRLLSPRENRVIFDESGSEFQLPLLCPLGRAVVYEALVRLQQLQHTLRVLSFLQRKGLKPLSFSLLRVAFTSSSGSSLRISMKPRLPQEKSAISNAQHFVTSPTLELYIHLPNQDPKKRIQGSLLYTLNCHDFEMGLNSTLRLLHITEPLLKTFETLPVRNREHTQQEPVSVEITMRQTKQYQVFYPRTGHRFQYSLHRKGRRLLWIVHNMTKGQKQEQWPQIGQELDKSVFNARGGGLAGYQEGAVADIENVPHLSHAIHQIMQKYLPSMDKIIKPQMAGNSKVDDVVASSANQPVVPASGPAVEHNAPADTHEALQPNQRTNVDVIMIDD